MRLSLPLVVAFILTSHLAFAQQFVPGTEVRVTQNAPLTLAPGTNRPPLKVAGVGSTLLVIKDEGEWLAVKFQDPQSRYGDRAAYVQRRFVEPVARPSASIPAPAASQTSSPPAITAPPTAAAPAPRPATAPRPSLPPAPAPQTVPAAATRTPSTEGRGAKLKNVKVRGYVTDVRSPTDFDIEDYRITKEQEFALDFENASPEITFQLHDIRVGVELEIRGTLNEDTGELKASAITVDLEQFKSIRQTAFVSHAPQGIQLLDGSWAGELHADGQTIRVTNATQVVFKPTKREKKLAEQQKKARKTEAEDHETVEPLESLDQVTVGMAMTYEGKRDRDTGKILADRIEFAMNDLEDGEAKMWKSLKTSVTAPKALKPGELKIEKVGKFTLVPDDEVQHYVRTLGQAMIPAYQRNLPDSDPRKIPFQFFVVQDKEVNAFATPNGIVVINSGLIEMLENEAQLAAIVGHEVAHSTHEHTWRGQQHKKKTRIGIALAGAVASAYGLGSLADIANMVNGAIVNGHNRSLENQSDRVGLEYMVDAGYDPRQAPAVWKLMAKENGVHATNFFWSSHENAPTRRSYLMNELKNNYRNLDFSTLRTNEAEFARVKAKVIDAKGQKAKIKVS